VDCRDNKSYKTVVIGSQTWMAQNLNYTPTGGNSWCYNDTAGYCDTYGRLYDWATAMGKSTSYNSTMLGDSANRQGICPSGWHVPSGLDWDILTTHVGGSSTGGIYLKAVNGWNFYTGISNLDTTGFSALPGGGHFETLGFKDILNDGYWWSTTENTTAIAYYRSLVSFNSSVGTSYFPKTRGFSLRCLKD